MAPASSPVTKWSCLEWEFNDDPDEINMWEDGNVIGSLNNMTVAYPAGKTPGKPLYNNTDSGLIGAFTASVSTTGTLGGAPHSIFTMTTIGIGIWDASFSAASWQTQAVWTQLKTIKAR
jgi:hypothetical protein